MRDKRWYIDILAHLRNKHIHGSGGQGLPVATENQTLRKNATVWEATSVLKVNADGPENTVDHSTGTNSRMVNVVYVASPGTLVAANTVPIGTLGIIYSP